MILLRPGVGDSEWRRFGGFMDGRLAATKFSRHAGDCEMWELSRALVGALKLQ